MCEFYAKNKSQLIATTIYYFISKIPIVGDILSTSPYLLQSFGRSVLSPVGITTFEPSMVMRQGLPRSSSALVLLI